VGRYRDVLQTSWVLQITASQLLAPPSTRHAHPGNPDRHTEALWILRTRWHRRCLLEHRPKPSPCPSPRAAGTIGAATTLITTATVNTGALLAMALSNSTKPGILILRGFLVGVSLPPIAPIVRAIYPQLVEPSAVRAPFALDTIAQELIWIAGPVITTSLAATISCAEPSVGSHNRRGRGRHRSHVPEMVRLADHVRTPDEWNRHCTSNGHENLAEPRNPPLPVHRPTRREQPQPQAIVANGHGSLRPTSVS